MKHLHAPVALGIGAGALAVIALSIVAEVQAHIAGAHIKLEASDRYTRALE